MNRPIKGSPSAFRAKIWGIFGHNFRRAAWQREVLSSNGTMNFKGPGLIPFEHQSLFCLKACLKAKYIFYLGKIPPEGNKIDAMTLYFIDQLLLGSCVTIMKGFRIDICFVFPGYSNDDISQQN